MSVLFWCSFWCWRKVLKRNHQQGIIETPMSQNLIKFFKSGIQQTPSVGKKLQTKTQVLDFSHAFWDHAKPCITDACETLWNLHPPKGFPLTFSVQEHLPKNPPYFMRYQSVASFYLNNLLPRWTSNVSLQNRLQQGGFPIPNKTAPLEHSGKKALGLFLTCSQLLLHLPARSLKAGGSKAGFQGKQKVWL